MVADDHEVVRKGVRALLESNPDFEIVGEAVNGMDAVEKTSALKPDIIIVDVSMGGMNGLEATRRIVKASPQTQVLILTIHDSETVALEALRAGARGYVLKSDAGRDLLSALDSLRHNRSFFTPTVSEMVLKGFRPGEAQPEESRLHRLTPREREILQILAEGKSNKEAAQQLGISLKTVDTHRTNIMSKLELHSVNELVRYAVREKIIEP
ncbi:MAG: response regulator transcription factor [Acidobacteria bacterium]|nr:response regulator transcription factor [Acidobacteriota bacterium]